MKGRTVSVLFTAYAQGMAACLAHSWYLVNIHWTESFKATQRVSGRSWDLNPSLTLRTTLAPVSYCQARHTGQKLSQSKLLPWLSAPKLSWGPPRFSTNWENHLAGHPEEHLWSKTLWQILLMTSQVSYFSLAKRILIYSFTYEKCLVA